MSPSRSSFRPGQLAGWLGIAQWQVLRAWEQGLIPGPDLDGHRWSYDLALTLPDRVEQIVAVLGDRYVSPDAAARRSNHTDSAAAADEPAVASPQRAGRVRKDRGFGPIQLARHLGLKQWQVLRGQQHGLVPSPDLDDARWSTPTAQELLDRVDEIRATVGDHPGLGAEKAAQRLAGLTGLPVERCDVQDLVERGLLHPVGDYRGWPLYALADLDALPRHDVDDAVCARQDWIAASLTAAEAADLLGWSVGRFEATAVRHKIAPGRLDRYARTDIAAIARTSPDPGIAHA
jgi:hypothetical protein